MASHFEEVDCWQRIQIREGLRWIITTITIILVFVILTKVLGACC